VDERRFSDLQDFLLDDARFAAALDLPGWRREERGPLWLADFDVVLIDIVSQVQWASRDLRLRWPAQVVDERHAAFQCVSETWGAPSSYGAGGYHRFHVQACGGVRMSAPHTGSGRQNDASVLVALWLDMPTYNVRFRDGADDARLVLLSEIDGRCAS